MNKILNKLKQYIDENLEIHEILNPKIWDENNKLLKEVEEKIYDIVDEFKKQLAKDNVELKISDIHILGSNANYNYTEESDLDVHIIADESFDCSEKHLQIIYNAYKALFNSKYDITIKGIDVEIYVESITDKSNASTGIYSLKKGWLKEPSHYSIPDIDEDKLEKSVAEWEDKYLELLRNPTTEKIESYINDIYDIRLNSIKDEGEFGLNNLVFKEIRRLKYLEKLKKLRLELKSAELSLR